MSHNDDHANVDGLVREGVSGMTNGDKGVLYAAFAILSLLCREHTQTQSHSHTHTLRAYRPCTARTSPTFTGEGTQGRREKHGREKKDQDEKIG